MISHEKPQTYESQSLKEHARPDNEVVWNEKHQNFSVNAHTYLFMLMLVIFHNGTKKSWILLNLNCWKLGSCSVLVFCRKLLASFCCTEICFLQGEGPGSDPQKWRELFKDAKAKWYRPFLTFIQVHTNCAISFYFETRLHMKLIL